MSEAQTVVVGAGVVGPAVARELALAGREVIVLERADRIGTETKGDGAARVPAFDEARDEFTRNYPAPLLQITRGNFTQAAKLAGRNRTDFYKLLSRHQLQPDDYNQR